MPLHRVNRHPLFPISGKRGGSEGVAVLYQRRFSLLRNSLLLFTGALLDPASLYQGRRMVRESAPPPQGPVGPVGPIDKGRPVGPVGPVGPRNPLGGPRRRAAALRLHAGPPAAQLPGGHTADQIAKDGLFSLKLTSRVSWLGLQQRGRHLEGQS